MSKEILTRCGYRCDLCLAYNHNIERDDQREFLSDTWYKLYGFRIPAQEIYCEGCISCNNPKLIDNECPVRPCVIKKSLENCSQCEDYPCGIFNQRKVSYEDFTQNKNVSGEEYSKCIKPYENKKRLDEIRNSNYPFSRLLNSEIVPDFDNIPEFINTGHVKNAWLDLLTFVDNTYNLDRKILFSGKKYGWAVQYKKNKKTIITIFPERDSFTILLIFGKSELEKIYSKKGLFSQLLIDTINITKQYHDGKWLWIRYQKGHFINDIKELIKIKTKPVAGN